MEHANEKLAIIHWLIQQNDAFTINQVKMLMEEIEADKKDSSRIVGQTPRGVRVSKKQLVERLQASLESMNSEEVIELDHLESLSDKW
jgi:hypothetical protein